MFKRELDPMVLLKDTKERDKMFNRYDQYQRAYYDGITGSSFVYCNSVSGTGKTLLAAHALLNLLSQGKIDRIIYLRFPSERDKKQGFIKGDLEDKCKGMWGPMYEAMLKLGFQPEAVDIMRDQSLVTMTTDIDKRGINFENAGVIVDEAQNGFFDDIKLVLTRLHDSCKCIFIGDANQLDNRKTDRAFERFGEYMSEPDWGTKVELKNNYRGKMSKRAEGMPREENS